MKGCAPVLRVARPTDDLHRLRAFYCDGLGFESIGSFDDHDGIDGLMLGRRGWPYHLEFTRHRGQRAPRAASPDQLLVFYLPERGEWQAAVARMNAAGFDAVPSANPYWDRAGATFEDPDGYRIVLFNAEWTP
jgi:catechol 2,3-dioxygenase-like lactoylglutathione lyase family enzyme